MTNKGKLQYILNLYSICCSFCFDSFGFVSVLSVSFAICCSFHFDSFGFVCNSFSFVHSFSQSICLRHFAISRPDQVRSSITVHLLYTSSPGSTVRLPHNFVFSRVLIILPVEVAIDTLIKTMPTAITPEPSIHFSPVKHSKRSHTNERWAWSSTTSYRILDIFLTKLNFEQRCFVRN